MRHSAHRNKDRNQLAKTIGPVIERVCRDRVLRQRRQPFPSTDNADVLVEFAAIRGANTAPPCSFNDVQLVRRGGGNESGTVWANSTVGNGSRRTLRINLGQPISGWLELSGIRQTPRTYVSCVSSHCRRPGTDERRSGYRQRGNVWKRDLGR
jgi:hypothetical protein